MYSLTHSNYAPERQLSLTGVSDNAGRVKHFSNKPTRALGEERHFALADAFAVSFFMPLRPR
jgi:hypothetical protein